MEHDVVMAIMGRQYRNRCVSTRSQELRLQLDEGCRRPLQFSEITRTKRLPSPSGMPTDYSTNSLPDTDACQVFHASQCTMAICANLVAVWNKLFMARFRLSRPRNTMILAPV
jgi:hypothetical protein